MYTYLESKTEKKYGGNLLQFRCNDRCS